MLRIGGAAFGAVGMSALLALGPANAGSAWMPPRSPPTPQQLGGMNGFHGGFHDGFVGGFFPGYYIEREVVHDVVVVHDQPVETVAPPEPPPPPRKPWVMGKSYSSLPSGCMKMIEDGISYFHCSGEWYREVGRGQYKAVSAPL